MARIACCLACFLGGLALPGVAKSHVNDVQIHLLPCKVLHGNRFCRAIELRKAAQILRAKEMAEIKRLKLKPPRRHPLVWKINKLYRHVNWLREERIPYLHESDPPPPPVSAHPLYRAFMCIHGGEGSWTANTGNGYYGGLQMDYSFQQSYGPEYLAKYGTANNWPPTIQLLVAFRAYYSGRGFYPWPNTARACGLI